MSTDAASHNRIMSLVIKTIRQLTCKLYVQPGCQCEHRVERSDNQCVGGVCAVEWKPERSCAA